MKQKQSRKWVLSLILVFSFLFVVSLGKSVEAATIRQTDVTTPSSGNLFVTVDGTFVNPGKDAVIKRLNEIRLEAYKNGWVKQLCSD